MRRDRACGTYVQQHPLSIITIFQWPMTIKSFERTTEETTGRLVHQSIPPFHNIDCLAPHTCSFDTYYFPIRKMKVSISFAVLSLSVVTAAHPGQSNAELKRESAERSAYLSTHKRSLAHCADQLKAKGNDVAMQNRRRSLVEKARQKMSISTGRLLAYHR